MARLGAWVQAGRPLAQISVLSTILFGQALAFRTTGAFQWKAFALAELLGLFIGLVAVFANDAVDVAVDVANTTYNRFSGSSRVVVERKLPPFALVQASLSSLLGVGAIATYLALRDGRPWMLVIASMTAHLAWMYGFPPFRLSYRGLGELVQAVGTALLVGIGYYATASSVEGLRPATFVPPFLLGYATNVTTGLADTPADAAANKRTLSVRRGERTARRMSLGAILIAAAVTPYVVPGASFSFFGLSVALGAAIGVAGFYLSRRADSSDREGCLRFMAASHAGIVLLFVIWSLALFAS